MSDIFDFRYDSFFDGGTLFRDCSNISFMFGLIEIAQRSRAAM
jgi:hypothetical protein